METVITQSREYETAISRVIKDILLLRGTVGIMRMRVRLPDDLVRKIGDSSSTLDLVSRGFGKRLGEFCPIGEWSSGKDENEKPYIQFYLLPESQ
jgi:hypothetical protein